MNYPVKELLSPYIYNDISGICQGQIDFNSFKDKTVLITGGGKLLGYYLACAFLISNDLFQNNTKVIVTDKEDNLFEKYGNITSREDIDLFISQTLSNLPREKADFVFHTDTTIGRDYFEAIENLLKYASALPDTQIVICSDMNIYGSVYNGKSKLNENDEGYVDLSSPDSYAIQSQRMVEAYGKKIVEETCAHIKFARVCSLLGALSINSNPLNRFITAALFEKNTKDDKHYITEQGNTIRSYCYVTDAVTALLKILLSGKDGEAYNIATGCDTSFNYIIEACRQLFPELDVNIAYKGNNISNDYSISPMNSTREIADNTKLLNLGFIPKVSLAEGIKRTVKIIEENI